MKYTITTLIILVILLSSCSSIRTDGAMRYNNTVKNMVYFNVDNYHIFINELEKDFGEHEKGKRESDYWWRNKTKKEWSSEVFDIKLLNTTISGDDKNNISIAIVTKTGRTLTDKSNPTLTKIKDYFSILKKITEEKNKR